VGGGGPEGAEALVGGKARNLARLVGEGLPVPRWFCLTTRLYDRAFGDLEGRIEERLSGTDFADSAAVRTTAAEIQEWIRARGLPAKVETELLTRFDLVFGPESRIAVRSSAVGEDSAADSFAGQMDSFLFVGRAELVERVLACFASAYSDRALLYRHVRNRPQGPARLAVVLQEMVDSRVSGVLFTRDPTDARGKQAMIAAAFGLGEGIVSGRVESDTFQVDVASGAVAARQITEKKSRVVFDAAPGRGTVIEEVPAEERRSATLTPDAIRSILDVGRRLERRFGAPQDVEWAIDRTGSLFLLQTRPITVLASGRESVFDNANIVESFPGLTLPLTFSFARSAYELVLTQASRRYGVSEKVLASQRTSLHANLVALIRGRMYYNLRNWYRLIEILPGCEWMLPGWEEALGLAPLSGRPRAPLSWRRRIRFAPSRARIAVRFLSELFVLDRDVARLLGLVETALADVRARDLPTMEAHELLELSESLMRELFEPYAIQNSNDDAAQQFFALLGRLMQRWNLGGHDRRNDLFSGQEGVASVEPVRSLLDLTAAVEKEDRLRPLFEGAQTDAEVWRELQASQDPAISDFRRLTARHIELYADRVLQELKLETPTLQENPSVLVAMIRNQLHSRSRLRILGGHERANRSRTEADIAARLRGYPLRRRIFDFVLRQARRTIKNREALRLARSRAVGIFKRIYRHIGQRFATRGLIGEAQDVFYLTTGEIEGAIRGPDVAGDLHELIALRKRDYERFAQEASPGRIVTYGIVHGAPWSTRAPAGVSAAAGSPRPAEGELRGIGCASGRTTAPAMVVLDPRDDLPVRGRILVTRTTDPGWVFLMVSAAGLVAEKGSPLSHTAIIGRELGIPTVVGVEDATRRIASGQTLEIDGATGTVRPLTD
jgi:pyruvate,water dikinase